MPHTTILLVLTALVLAPLAVTAKTTSTYYTPERVNNARRNIERYKWAREMRDKTVQAADKYAAQTDDFLWELVTPQDIPRGIHVNKVAGCPSCGQDINAFGNYPWKCDVFARPWKIECPSCGSIYPTNDFGRYYESGKDSAGVFRMGLGDRSLLYNTGHPDPSDPLHTYGVDDGLGWKDKNGSVYRFVGYYGHYGSWAAVSSGLGSLAQAYVYTADTRYARKAALMLYRVAQFYPDMDWSVWGKLGFENSDGLSGMGKIYGRIWETGVAQRLITAYDAIYPALDDASLLRYLAAKTGRQVTAADVRALVEKNILLETHDGILACRIAGNEGMHQYTMALAAVVLDEPGTTQEWLDWVFAPGNLLGGDPAGGNILRLFETKIDSDGMGNEASPAYNGIWRGKLRAISELLDVYPRYTGPKISEMPKYRRMFETPVRLISLDRFIPLIGDTGKTGAPDLGGITVEELAHAFTTFGDPLYARMASYLNGHRTEGIRGSIYDAEPEAVAAQIEAVVRRDGPYAPRTEHLPGYGLALLRSGSGESARALSLYYGRNTGHGHKDTLNFELFGYGLDLMPDLGYPEYASQWPHRQEWVSNTISHNTVVVDRRKQANSYSGEARFVIEGKGASAAEVSAKDVYPQASLYQRTIALVDFSEDEFYVVDIFRVNGGADHIYSLHGPEGAIEAEGLDLVAQPTGTLAGPDVEYEADLGGRENYWSEASGFQYLYNIRRDAEPQDAPAVTWKVVDTWKVLKDPRELSLRINLLRPPGEVILACGKPPRNKPGNPKELTYLLATNGSSAATFVSVIEPYSGTRCVSGLERIDSEDAVGVKVTLRSGRVDYIVSRTGAGGAPMFDLPFGGRFAVLTRDAGGLSVRLAVDE